MKKIYLYLAIPERHEELPIRRSTVRWLRNRARRGVDIFSWLLTRKFDFHFSTYEDVRNSNKGDIAIRIAIRQQIERFFPEDAFPIVEIGWGELTPSLVESINRDGALFVIGGSGYFHFGRTGDLHPMCRSDLEMLTGIKCHKITYGTGVNRLLTDSDDPSNPSIQEDSITLLSAYAEQLSLISVRDEFSRGVFARASQRNVTVIADPVLSMCARDSPSDAVDNKESPQLRIGINFAFHGPTANRVLRRNFRLYPPILKTLVKRYRCSLYYFVHSDAEQLIPLLFRLSGVPVEVVSGSPEYLLENYSGLSIHISQMMHSSVLALAAGIPTLNLAYDVKCHSFYELMGLQRYSIKALGFSPEALLSSVDSLLERRNAVALQIAERRSELEARNRNFLAQVREML